MARIAKVGTVLGVVLAVLLSFQHCSPQTHLFSWDGALQSGPSTNGNGGTYDGKPEPGTYYRVVPDYRCGSDLASYGEIEVATDKVTLRTIDSSTCKKIETPLKEEQLERTPLNRQLIGFSDGTFERRKAAPDLSDRALVIPEIWCKSEASSSASGLETVVRTAPAAGLAEPIVARGSVDSSGQFSVEESIVSNAVRQVSGRTLVVKGDDYELSLDLSSGTAATSFKVTARLRARVASRDIDEVMTCRRGGNLDVVAPIPALTCPANYVRVPGLAGYSDSDFCIAKYEARSSGGKGVSSPQGLPWTQVDRAGALSACGANGLGFDLISNDEWMATARNMENVAWNWSGGAVGSTGGLSIGHSDNNPNSTLAASTDENDACFGTGQSCSLAVWNSQRRVHQLSTGDLIWDMSGNVWEWMKDWDNVIYGTTDYYMSTLTDTTHGSVPTKQRFGPAGDYTMLAISPFGGLGFGEVAAGNIGTILRGGNFQLNDQSGLFSFSTQVQPYSTDPTWGFRCVYHP